MLRKGEMRHGSCLQISFPGEDRAWCVLAVSWLCHYLMGTSKKITLLDTKITSDGVTEGALVSDHTYPELK